MTESTNTGNVCKSRILGEELMENFCMEMEAAAKEAHAIVDRRR
jgi:hypothetical protein